ncbi:SIS domain-containing protein [Povalibacter sp.]|uniref:SIS domain-containing protein n=1 Tax=Povalibacter sp. TaxID=1962978 RepID=UPI0032C226E2
MFREAAEAPEVVRKQIQANEIRAQELGDILQRRAPRAVVTCARGSSDHAATFARYLIETHVGVLTSSASPSLSSVYATSTDLRDAAFIAISQSGKSPDLLAAAERARQSGAFVIALSNTPDSPLARLAHYSMDLHAGAETSVAATKSYIASLSAIVHIVANWTRNAGLLDALLLAPQHLREAWSLDWSAAIAHLRSAINLFVVGRGYGLAIAQEAALKLKETCGLHAEGFSAAEVQHGPMALVRPGFPVLAFSQSDETRGGIETLSRNFLERGATLLLAGGRADGAIALPVVAAHPVIEPMLMIQSFYRLAASLALARGLDPDVPPHLRKVTETF